MRVQTAPGIWKDEGPGRALTHNATGYVVRPVLTVGSMVPLTDMRERVSDKRRQQMAEASQRRRDKLRG